MKEKDYNNNSLNFSLILVVIVVIVAIVSILMMNNSFFGNVNIGNKDSINQDLFGKAVKAVEKKYSNKELLTEAKLVFEEVTPLPAGYHGSFKLKLKFSKDLLVKLPLDNKMRISVQFKGKEVYHLGWLDINEQTLVLDFNLAQIYDNPHKLVSAGNSDYVFCSSNVQFIQYGSLPMNDRICDAASLTVYYDVGVLEDKGSYGSNDDKYTIISSNKFADLNKQNCYYHNAAEPNKKSESCSISETPIVLKTSSNYVNPADSLKTKTVIIAQADTKSATQNFAAAYSDNVQKIIFLYNGKSTTLTTNGYADWKQAPKNSFTTLGLTLCGVNFCGTPVITVAVYETGASGNKPTYSFNLNKDNCYYYDSSLTEAKNKENCDSFIIVNPAVISPLNLISGINLLNPKTCTDADSYGYFTKSVVVSALYPKGKEDECKEFSDGKIKLSEGICINGEYAAEQKNCDELGKDYVCNEGACVKSTGVVLKGFNLDSSTINNIGYAAELTAHAKGIEICSNPSYVIEPQFVQAGQNKGKPSYFGTKDDANGKGYTFKCYHGIGTEYNYLGMATITSVFHYDIIKDKLDYIGSVKYGNADDIFAVGCPQCDMKLQKLVISTLKYPFGNSYKGKLCSKDIDCKNKNLRCINLKGNVGMCDNIKGLTPTYDSAKKKLDIKMTTNSLNFASIFCSSVFPGLKPISTAKILVKQVEYNTLIGYAFECNHYKVPLPENKWYTVSYQAPKIDSSTYSSYFYDPLYGTMYYLGSYHASVEAYSKNNQKDFMNSCKMCIDNDYLNKYINLNKNYVQGSTAIIY